MTKFIVVAGGVMSGVGKGVTTASIGKILQEHGYTVTAIKIDPYLNYDAGTLRPTEHGEVWVTDDGGEIDQDLGTYERFLNLEIPKRNNITTGQVYKTVIDRERQGEYLGQTVQFIPHIPDEIKKRIKEASDHNDFVLVEVGGTIGDYENIPFLFALKSLERDIGTENLSYVLVTYLPIPSHIEEMKTKPTQQAIRLLSESGIFPDFIICRAKRPLDSVRKKKIETYANIISEHVISEPDIESVYQIPLDLEKERFGEKILKEFKMKSKKSPQWSEWKKLVENILNPKKTVKIAIVGKYIDIGDYNLADSYISINQALLHAGASLNTGVEINWLDSKKFEDNKKSVAELKNYDGVIVPGGFGGSGVEGKITAINYARINKIPYLGLCYGLQMAAIEFARNVCNLKDAHTTEIAPKTKVPIIDVQPTQRKILEKSMYGGTMRLGAYAAIMKDKSQVLKLYQDTGRLKEDTKKLNELMKDKKQAFRIGILEKNKKIVLERHRHRYEVNPDYVDLLEKNGLIFSGYYMRADHTPLMEYIELPGQSFRGTQGHPEFKSRLGNPSPLFYGFVRDALKYSK
ncbi:CTP synthetase [Candidatus Woesearchaeota archaeon]|jgi:CTP synthase|nr:CTP synthetase [Candidatus Woesearchaeota archaeon]|tara:strand:+ start:19810 stop:21534 length:1725 start_codon:yes stop_codon:yes gene_type:complete